jgi:DNA-entry nuclease
MKKLFRLIFIVLIVSCLVVGGCLCVKKLIEQSSEQSSEQSNEQSIKPADGLITIDSIPDYSGSAYVVIKNNIPSFPMEDFTTTSFETYCELDEYGRCSAAYANIGTDLMPTIERDSIGQIKPSGWQTVKYDNVDGKYLYNRCHLIGYQLTAENANERNLVTGTRYLNIEGMLPFENMIADYVKETKNHVLYRVTPIFEGDNLVASGVQMEGNSVEDKGEGICFNIYAYNVQPGIMIDYLNGESYLSDTEQRDNNKEQTLIELRGNSNSMIYHCPGQAAYEELADSKYLIVFYSEQEALDVGYRRAKR